MPAVGHNQKCYNTERTLISYKLPGKLLPILAYVMSSTNQADFNRPPSTSARSNREVIPGHRWHSRHGPRHLRLVMHPFWSSCSMIYPSIVHSLSCFSPAASKNDGGLFFLAVGPDMCWPHREVQPRGTRYRPPLKDRPP